ncbi:MAG: hypothetical protein P1U61_04250 [Legionellaceae bacterium]|nr:hypothetical protein [Legionellaceae bacterium]
MKRALVAPLSEVAYKIFLTPSASITEKAAQFAGCVAHQASSSHLPRNRSDAFGRLAAQNMLNLIQSSYQYSSNQADKSTAVQEAQAEQVKAQVPWIQTPTPPMPCQNTQLESLEMIRSRTFHDNGYLTNSDTVFKSKCLNRSQNEIESSSNIYPKAYCVAFLAFERAAKTNTQQQFESIIQKELMQELAEPFSYTEFCLQILKSKELSAIMGVVLVLGLILLALPSFEVVFMAETTTYALGGSMAFLGSAYHLWRLFSPAPKTSEEDSEKLLVPQSL